MKGSPFKAKVKKKILFLFFKYDIAHTNDNVETLGVVYKHRVIQVNGLSQVLAHRDKLRGEINLPTKYSIHVIKFRPTH